MRASWPPAWASPAMLLLLLVSVLCGCGDSGGGAVDADLGAPVDGPPALEGGADLPPDAGVDAVADAGGCGRTPPSADRTRKVVVSHPFGEEVGSHSPLFEVLELSMDGELTRTGETFELGRASSGVIHFTPDGEVGLVALGDGKIGVFRFDDGGMVEVVHEGFEASGYASRLVMDPGGEEVYALSSQWRDSGGGIYRLRIGCDGTLIDEGLAAASRLPYAMRFVDDTRALVVADDVLDSEAGAEVHLLQLAGQPAVLGSSTAFGDDDAIVSSAALSGAGHLLVADASMFGGRRLAVVSLSAAGVLAPVQVITDVDDPAAVVISPFDNAAIVLNGEGDAITVLDYDAANGQAPFAIRGALQTPNKPLLPVEAVMIRRGSFEGRVLTSENVGVRQIQFGKGGEVKDAGFFAFGEGSTSIVGAIGVQP